MNLHTFGFIGLGLIGGSIAKAIKKAHPSSCIIAYDNNAEMLEKSLSKGIADITTIEINEVFNKCDMIFLCAPVSVNNINLKLLAPFLSPDTILTDVGSVKTPIHEAIQELGLEKQFIGGHPMAGSEKSGFENSNPVILENAYYVLTPTKEISRENIETYTELVKNMGSIPLVLEHDEHDYVVAAVSHVPHLIAAALANLVKDHDNNNGTMKLIAAGGFKDITRIASSSPDMWEAICMSNAENISKLMDDYIASLTEINNSVKNHKTGYTYNLFRSSKEYRDSFTSQPHGPIKKVYGCYVDIPDEAGAIASIATLLAKSDVSIKNIGIVHNREFEEGVLQIEFYEQQALDEAVAILQSLDYEVYPRK